MSSSKLYKRSLYKKSYFNNVFLFILLNLLLTQNCTALPADKQQPIELEADSADINDQKGISIYQGKVILIQGNTELKADKVSIFHDKDHQVIKIIALGSPARYKQTADQQTLDNQQKDIKARATKMIFYAKKDLIHLYGHAVLEQAINSFSGDKIIYNTKKNIVKASSKKSADGSIISSGRVKVTIQTEKNK